ncbi:hypothetical protein FPANT_6161 [Fusarium pseudoanthophilum]|uniref:Meiotically up-regulated gene 154 protein n=1 Tax=Fusarium pseudoanthophilum TaxID=48495 RepID=A0A8H5LF12_9HYPO|nr:hypothetical protein FPANT_6161 [Fusarium pseudoanthophilum]
MPRLVRRQPLRERIMAAINPMDFLLWLSEELETRDWDSASVGTQMGLAMNFAFLLARANSGSSTPSDDIFSDESSSGWLSFLVYPVVWALIAFSFTNAFYTITRTRKYRLFLAKVDRPLSTPSARRVKVNQSSASPSTPLGYLANLITPESAESRAHPDKTSDVWELSVWDPLPVSLRLSCLFGPGHVLVYMIFLPLAPLDPRPSVTVLNTLILQGLVSAQLLFFCSRFAQQAKDKAVIQEQVMKEYDTKFVHPRLHPMVRDIGTQFSADQPDDYQEVVQTGTPTVQIRHGFQVHSNPYTGTDHTPEERSLTPTSNNVMKPHMFTPPTATRRSEAFRPATSQRGTVPRHSLPAGYTSTGTSSGVQGMNFGGNMGIHTHNKSPLKKATSLNELHPQEAASPRNSREMAAYEQRNWGATTPSKKLESRRLTGSRPNGGGNPFAGLVPEPTLAFKDKGNEPSLSTHRRWNEFVSLRTRKKRGQKKQSESLETGKGKEEQPGRRSSRAQSFEAAFQGTPSILEVLEANRKARRKAREDRESLRESGDYLGVQGVNPQTGILDLTSDSGESTLSSKTEQKLLNLEAQAKNSLSATERKEAEIEIVKVHLDHEVAKARRQEKAEKQLAASATAKWRRGTHQWSSVQQPDLSPIAQSHRSTSVFSSQRSLANPSPSALELFENDIKFHNPSDPRLDRDQIPESLLVSAHDDTQIQTPANETQYLQVNEKFHETGGTGRNPDTSSVNQEGLFVGSLDETKPHSIQHHPLTSEEQDRDTKPTREQHSRKLRARFDDHPREIHYPPDNIGTDRVKFPRKPVPTLSSASPHRTCIEPAPNRKLQDTVQFGARGIEQLSTVSNSPTAPETNNESWDHKRPTAPERGKAVRSQGAVCIHKHHHHYWVRPDKIEIPPEERSRGRGGPTAQTQAKSGNPQPEEIRHNAKQLGSFPRESWTEYIAEIGVGGRDSTDRYYIGESPRGVEKSATGTGGEPCSSSSTSTCTMGVKGFEKGDNMENILQRPSPQLSNLDLLSQIYMPGVSNRPADPGMHVPGNLPRQWNAEDGIADLSSNRSRQRMTGGLWDAIKEFLCTIKGYSIQLLRLYWKAVKPVFDYSSPYWRATDRESEGWSDLASTCLALPLVFGLLMILVWGMEFTAITMKCREEEWDCLLDEALAMFRRSLTGVYMDD